MSDFCATVLSAVGVLAQSAAPSVPAPCGASPSAGVAATGSPSGDWRRVGNSSIDLSLAALAAGPVDRVWYSASGSLLIHTASGRVFETSDSETWHRSAAQVPAEVSPRVTPV